MGTLRGFRRYDRICLLSLGLAGTVPSPGAPAEAAITRGPYLQALLDTSVEVIWLTDLESTGKVIFRADAGGELAAVETAPATAHRVQLTGLSPGTVHHYQVLDGERPLHATPFRFRAAPPAGSGEIRVAVAGDSGDGSDVQRAIAAMIEGLEPDLFLHTGDLDYTGDIDCGIFAPFGGILASAGFYPSLGNHDLVCEAGAAQGGCGLADPDAGEVNVLCDWREVFFLPAGSPDGPAIFYSFDWGPAHFAAFDTNSHALAGGDQLRWLEADLEAARARGARWLILYFHEPVITVGSYSESLQLGQLKAPIVIPPIADRFEVDLVLSGHDHNYQRSHPVRGGVVHDAWQDPTFVSPRGTIYLVTGGGGRQLYPEIEESDHRFTRLFLYAHHALEIAITPDRLTVRALSPAEEVLDEFSITKEGARPELRFIRGDANADGAVNLADAVRALGYLFLGTMLECPLLSDTIADADGSGTVAINDPIFLLNHLFLGGPAPPGPFPECGTGPGADDAWCTRSGCAR